ncbi:hypothetical protein [Streptomyces sp. VRA16 Mangrove soil]|nr:hypothetical protein [Streptomyces sp. VRA16 Mangrove soil]
MHRTHHQYSGHAESEHLMSSTSNRSVVVTGAGSGIGRAAAPSPSWAT